MNAAREPGAAAVSAGEIAALGLIHEASHLLILAYETQRRPNAMADALADLDADLGPDAVRVLDRFGQEFPGAGPLPEPARDRLEEMLLIHVANENPALGPLRELVDDRVLARDTRYAEALTRVESSLADGPPVEGAAIAPRRHARARSPLADIAGRPAALHPRPLGRTPRAGPARPHRPARDLDRDPRGGTAGAHPQVRGRTRCRARPGRDPGRQWPRATKRRPSRPTRPGCPRSC